MPMYDRMCSGDSEGKRHVKMNCWEAMSAENPPCETCGAPTMRVWLGKAPGVKADSIPGGKIFTNGICYEDGTPRKFYHHSEIAEEMKRKNVMYAEDLKATRLPIRERESESDRMVTDAIHREYAQAANAGVDESRPGSEREYLDKRDGPGA